MGVEERHIRQIKEKMAELRVYISNSHLNEEQANKAVEIVTRYQEQSRITCEKCGKPGQLMKSERGWYFTRCPECNNGKLTPRQT